MSSLTKNDLKYWVGFTYLSNIGPVRFSKLRKSFPSLEEAWRAPISTLKELGFTEAAIAECIRVRGEINLEQELEKLEKEQISIVTIDDEEYPTLLKEIYYPPFLLYYRGTLPKHEDYLLAIVGSRKYSTYGKQMAQRLAGDLSRNGLTIVSGLALGIDGITHQATLEANGKTIGVLGCGIERSNMYPSSNRILGERMIEHGGCVISEHPIGTPPFKSNFPRRNRIIAGISLGTLVIEAAEKSGALITANYALEQNREVFSVPGNATSESSIGTNNLIKQGARAVTDASEILESLNLKQATEYLSAQKIIPENPEEEAILAHLTHEPLYIDELTALTKLPITVINATLTIMEMKGKVKNLGAMKYVLTR
ncbi:DNA protecting protein DprA [bacterium CG10_46_32]|nr:MAG: DNA protecting protein DprA [bacterium CG10_46_32]PIR56462.1 MAG: DNA-protecting protein DprA [Parcubacteria group bacterium CG10_big_fil_rev_8_21_14_0_10_46_32]